MLAKVYESPEITGYITQKLANKTGTFVLRPLWLVVLAIMQRRQLARVLLKMAVRLLTIGTSGVVFAHSSQVKIRSKGAAYIRFVVRFQAVGM